ncbi:unnamed protein product [Rotaria magnacalcarata]|uniref:Beta-1,3-galactosyl-O-glycosyl-glycoprotein beta-1,6-N-acetylglucosaminyltransferase n=5 Tax=Rotaria magnacalcarata TaxID=392030 RepID=A0A816B055_9BILA|nr:unnamed protein product [Rotaria magnacalcarata]CAF2133816.1 unnamed protein product [Rotaria magnacalcarata]CAF3968040.1 unnamed protein product [Rotaria magnacalcarata]
MPFTINRRLLKHNCLLFFGFLFIFELIQIAFFSRVNFNATVIQLPNSKLSKNTNRLFFQPYHYPISCQKLFESDPSELKNALALLSRTKNISLIANSRYNIEKEQCSAYRSERFNESFHVADSSINRQFPLAFNILLYENVEQFERLLRIIYRPQNFYCIHVDSDASLDVAEGVQSIVQCFKNIFLSSKREKVIYATFSRLQADLNCMKDLIEYPSWKYLLNIANTELPLKTNSELVKILSIYRGYNDIEGRWKSRNTLRTDYVWEVIESINTSYISHLRRTKQKKKPPPGNVEIVKGSAYGAFSRAFVEFVQKSSIAKELLDWSRDTFSPDEHYWATLNYNIHLRAPGGYKAKSDPTQWTARYVIWGKRGCQGIVVHGICILSTADLPTLYNRHELFANKFQLKVDPIAYQCLEEFLINKSQLNLPLNDAAYYRKMPFLLPS